MSVYLCIMYIFTCCPVPALHAVRGLLEGYQISPSTPQPGRRGFAHVGKGDGRIVCTGHAPQTITVWWKALREIGCWSWPHLLIKWALQIGFKSRRGAVEHWECSQSLYGTLQDPFQLLCQRWIHDEITSASMIVSAIYSGFQQCSDLRGEDFANLNKLITDGYLKLTEIHVWENQTGTGLECGRQSELHIAEP